MRWLDNVNYTNGYHCRIYSSELTQQQQIIRKKKYYEKEEEKRHRSFTQHAAPPPTAPAPRNFCGFVLTFPFQNSFRLFRFGRYSLFLFCCCCCCFYFTDFASPRPFCSQQFQHQHDLIIVNVHMWIVFELIGPHMHGRLAERALATWTRAKKHF